MPVSLIGITLPALTFALSIDRILNGVTRPFFGWVSDHIGRENTMFIAFGLEAVGIWALSSFGHDPVMFVILSGLVFFAWGEIYSLFPATCTDAYGTKYATTNAGLLYTAKGTASLLVPLGNVLATATGSWHSRLPRRRRDEPRGRLALAVLRPLRGGAAGRPPGRVGPPSGMLARIVSRTLRAAGGNADRLNGRSHCHGFRPSPPQHEGREHGFRILRPHQGAA